METIIFVLVVVLVIAVAASRGGGSSSAGGGLVSGGLGGASHDAQMEAAAAHYGVTLRHTYLIHGGGGGRYSNDTAYVYGFRGIDKAGVEVTGQIRVGFGNASVTFDSSGAGARAARAQGRLAEAELVDETTLDPEEQVRREVARRLDTLQANRDAFMSHDTDGDGMVDADEWAAARARIEQQVREELLGDEPAEQPDAPPPTESVQGDGQW